MATGFVTYNLGSQPFGNVPPVALDQNFSDATSYPSLGQTAWNGQAVRSHAAKIAEMLAFSVKDASGVVGDGVNDDTTGIQNAVNAAGAATNLTNTDAIAFFPPSRYKTTAQINALKSVHLVGVRVGSTILLATQNQNGVVFGDGSAPTRLTASQSSIENIGFNPFPGVTAFTAGSCVVRNNVYNTHVLNCDFYGADSGLVTKFWNGITDIACDSCFSDRCTAQYLANNVVNISGLAGNLCSNMYYNYLLYNNIGNDAIFIGTFIAGLYFGTPNGFKVGVSSAAYHIHINTSTGSNGQNIFISNPDFECDTLGNGIWIQQGNGVGIGGEGWIGGNGNTILIWFGANCSNCKAEGLNLNGGKVLIDGPSCHLKGGTLTGDNVTSTTGVTITSTATNGNIDGTQIAQYITSAVNFASGPPSGFKVRAHFNSIGSNSSEITGLATNNVQPPDCRGCTTDASTSLTAVAALPLNFGREFAQVTGTTAITSMTIKSQGERQILQALSAAGMNINNTAGIIMKAGANLNIPQFKIIEFVCDGNATWFESTRNF